MLAAAAGVFGTGTAWPDLVVAGIMAALGLSGGWQIIRQGSAELTGARLTPATSYRGSLSLRSQRPDCLQVAKSGNFIEAGPRR